MVNTFENKLPKPNQFQIACLSAVFSPFNTRCHYVLLLVLSPLCNTAKRFQIQHGLQCSSHIIVKFLQVQNENLVNRSL